jgi:hypothetical protein
VDKRIARLRHALVEATAGQLRAEFEREHRLDGRGDLFWCSNCGYGAAKLRPHYQADPRHAWTAAEWQQKAVIKLKAEELLPEDYSA